MLVFSTILTLPAAAQGKLLNLPQEMQCRQITHSRYLSVAVWKPSRFQRLAELQVAEGPLTGALAASWLCVGSTENQFRSHWQAPIAEWVLVATCSLYWAWKAIREQIRAKVKTRANLQTRSFESFSLPPLFCAQTRSTTDLIPTISTLPPLTSPLSTLPDRLGPALVPALPYQKKWVSLTRKSSGCAMSSHPSTSASRALSSARPARSSPPTACA